MSRRINKLGCLIFYLSILSLSLRSQTLQIDSINAQRIDTLKLFGEPVLSYATYVPGEEFIIYFMIYENSKKLARIYELRNGRKFGTQLTWFPNGNLAELNNFEKGSEIGPNYNWYDTGNLKERNYFLSNYDYFKIDSIKKDTSYSDYFTKNTLFTNKAKINEGVKIIWFENGKVKSIEKYENGLLNGLCRYYDMNGNEIKKQRFIKGKLQY